VPAGRDETGWPPGPLPGRRQFRGGIGNPSPRPSASAGCSPGPGDGGPSRMRAAAGRPRPATTTRASAFPSAAGSFRFRQSMPTEARGWLPQGRRRWSPAAARPGPAYSRHDRAHRAAEPCRRSCCTPTMPAQLQPEALP